MDVDKMLADAKQSTADQRAANQAVLDSVIDFADLDVLRRAADTAIQLAKAPAGNPQ